jgi:hypothetical protein
VRQRLQQRARGIDPGDAELEAGAVPAHRGQPPAAALDPDQREVEIEAELCARDQRRVAAHRPQRHPTGADREDPEAQGLLEEPRAGCGRERRQFVGTRVAGRLAAIGVSGPRRLGQKREPDPRERAPTGPQAAGVPHLGGLPALGRAGARVADADDLARIRQHGLGQRQAEPLGRQVDRLGVEQGVADQDLELQTFAEIDTASVAPSGVVVGQRHGRLPFRVAFPTGGSPAAPVLIHGLGRAHLMCAA